ncbi:MAG TPA: alpha/beta hydrolase [Nitrososphaeraceae archaeon]|jgi:phospholipase/carboxylesterase/glyoxalase family protein
MDKTKTQLGFIHRFIPPKNKKSKVTIGTTDDEEGTQRETFTTFLLLHGTGGNEEDLIPLAHELDKSVAILSPRGKVLENGTTPRSFRRLAEGVFDLEDLKFRTNELANFVIDASKSYNFDLQHVIAVGYSNGANIAASMLLLRPEILSSAILFRAMVPLVPQTLPNLGDKHIFMSSGLYDPIVSRQEAEKLFSLYKKAGANISLSWQESGHELTMEEVRKAKEWLLHSASSPRSSFA